MAPCPVQPNRLCSPQSTSVIKVANIFCSWVSAFFLLQQYHIWNLADMRNATTPWSLFPCPKTWFLWCKCAVESIHVGLFFFGGLDLQPTMQLYTSYVLHLKRWYVWFTFQRNPNHVDSRGKSYWYPMGLIPVCGARIASLNFFNVNP